MSDHAEHPQAPAGASQNAGHTAGHDEIVHGHEAHTATPEEDNLPIGKVVMVGVASLLIFAIGGIWALKMRTGFIASMNPTGAPALPANLGAEEQGMVDQIPFDLNHWVKDDRAAAANQLLHYGWVDQKAGTIHIPIERAIELQLAEKDNVRAPVQPASPVEQAAPVQPAAPIDQPALPQPEPKK